MTGILGWCRRRERDERGATLAIVGMLLVALVGSGAMAVDLGMQRVARSDAQATADMIALDLARSLHSRRTTSWYDDQWAMPGGDLALALARNQSAAGAAPPPPGPSWLCNRAVCARARAGTLDRSGRFVLGTAGGVPTAVSVEVDGRALFGLARVLGIASGDVGRTAVGEARPPASCYAVGSYALGLATNSAILGPLLGDAAAARILGYHGLGTARVSLLALAGELDAGTAQQLLTMPDLTVGSLLGAAADVLDARGDAASVALAGQVTGLAVDLGPLVSTVVPIGDLISLGEGDGSALDADVDLLDLVTGAVIAAGGGHALAVPAAGLDLGPLGSLSASLYLTQPPRMGCNGAPARAAQGHLDLTGSLTIAGVATLRDVTLTLSLADATAALAAGDVCGPDAMRVDVSDRALARVRLTADVYAALGLVRLGSIDSGEPEAPAAASYVLPLPASYTTPVETGSGSLGLDLSHVTLDATGISLGAVVSGLAPLVSGVSGLLTGTVLPGLGITTDGADLWAVSPHSCGGVALVG